MFFCDNLVELLVEEVDSPDDIVGQVVVRGN